MCNFTYHHDLKLTLSLSPQVLWLCVHALVAWVRTQHGDGATELWGHSPQLPRESRDGETAGQSWSAPSVQGVNGRANAIGCYRHENARVAQFTTLPAEAALHERFRGGVRVHASCAVEPAIGPVVVQGSSVNCTQEIPSDGARMTHARVRFVTYISGTASSVQQRHCHLDLQSDIICYLCLMK